MTILKVQKVSVIWTDHENMMNHKPNENVIIIRQILFLPNRSFFFNTNSVSGMHSFLKSLMMMCLLLQRCIFQRI